MTFSGPSSFYIAKSYLLKDTFRKEGLYEGLNINGIKEVVMCNDVAIRSSNFSITFALFQCNHYIFVGHSLSSNLGVFRFIQTNRFIFSKTFILM